MVQIYETFIWWLTLWLPECNDLAWMLDDASYDHRTEEFWEAIAPPQWATSPWEIRRIINMDFQLGLFDTEEERTAYTRCMYISRLGI